MALVTVVLGDGREVELVQFHLDQTYGEVIEGYPCAPINDSIINGTASQASQIMPGAPVHIVDPERTLRASQAPGGFGPVEHLPPVRCVGRFRSSPTDPKHDFSSLVIVWWQVDATLPDHYAAPLRDVPWRDLAVDQSW